MIRLVKKNLIPGGMNWYNTNINWLFFDQIYIYPFYNNNEYYTVINKYHNNISIKLNNFLKKFNSHPEN